jgi:hypothetical protein
MNLNFIGDGCHAILKFVHCHETNDKAAKIVESTAKTVMTVTEQARTQGQSVNVTINQSFHFGSGTYINLTPESQAVFNFGPANQPVIPPKNPTATISQSCLLIEDLTLVYNTMILLGMSYGFCLFLESWNFEKNSRFQNLSYEDQNFLDSEIAFWKKFVGGGGKS